VYDLVYYSHSDPPAINTDLPSGFTVKRTDIDALPAGACRFKAALSDALVQSEASN